MYDIIIGRSVNKRKITIVIATLLIVEVIAVIGGIKYADHKYAKEEAIKLQEKAAQIEQAEAEKKAEKEREEQAKIQERIQKTSQPFNEEQQYNILHIYKSDTKRVFLTFDDGPSETVTPLILDLLKEENVPATFFTLGTNVKKHPEIVRREFDEGHYVANHGYSHKYSAVYASPQATFDEYNYTENAIKEALGNENYKSNLFRFPGGSNGGYYDSLKQESKALLRENGIVHLDWNCLSKDAEGAHSTESLIQNIKDTADGKYSVVVLMHDSSDKILTYESLKEVINYFRENGYEFKNIYDII